MFCTKEFFSEVECLGECGEKIKLTYFLIKSAELGKESFGIVVVSQTEKSNLFEECIIKDISCDRLEIQNLLEKFCRCKVTTLTALDIIEDYLGMLVAV